MNKTNIRSEINKLRNEFETLPEKGRLNLGSKGLVILSKINKLEARIGGM